MTAAIQFYNKLTDGPDFVAEMVQGLRARSIAPKFFYDARGSALFDEICELPEYYLTRTEIALLRRHAADIAKRVDRDAVLVELGSGASLKVRLLLEALRPQAYLGIDISCDFLISATRRLARDYPWLEVHAACADYSQPLTLSYPPPEKARLIFFPGSSIGNFKPEEAACFLRQLHTVVRPGGGMLVGVDLRKDPDVINGAYNDTRGVTAAFNRNLLHRLKREFGAEVNPEAFAHEAVYDAHLGRIEMYLVSQGEQEIRFAGERFAFARGERLHTEYSYKYSIDGFRDLAQSAGYTPEAVWTDARNYFSLHYLRLPK